LSRVSMCPLVATAWLNLSYGLTFAHSTYAVSETDCVFVARAVTCHPSLFEVGNDLKTSTFDAVALCPPAITRLPLEQVTVMVAPVLVLGSVVTAEFRFSQPDSGPAGPGGP
jgi:hypothetical protein